MKRIITVFFLLFIGINCFGQKLTLTDLNTISNKKNWEYVNQYLMNKGWEYHESQKGNSENYNTIIWSYNKSYDDKAEAWFYLYTYEGFPNKISYSVFNKASYTTIQKKLNSKGFKLSKSEIEDDALISTYTNSKFILKITTEKRKREYEESLTGYTFLCIKKSGIYDPDNGKKIDYYYNGLKEIEYTLKNGKLNGKLISYYSDGVIKMKGTYLNGQRNGAFKDYFENGNLEFEYSMKKGVFNGAFKIYYESGELKMTGFYSNGKKQGKFIEYDKKGNKAFEYSMDNDKKNGLDRIYINGKLVFSTNFKEGVKEGKYHGYYYDKNEVLFLKEYGQYLNGQKEGLWEVFLIKEGKEELFTYMNYLEDLKDGAFQKIKGDSLILGNYQKDKLNGTYKLYRDVSKTLFGGIIKTDTTKLDLIEDGVYYKDQKTGRWKNYDFTGTLTSEGNYSKDNQIGEWKYYHSRYSDKNGGFKPYSGELFLVRNFKDGNLDGKSIRYSYLNEKKISCSEVDENKNPLDTCSVYVHEKLFEKTFYKNNKLNGPFVLKDSTDQIISKGIFIDDLLEGVCIESYVQKTKVGKSYYVYQEGSYSRDEREGQWIEYTTKDTILSTFNYKNGRLHGKYTKWNDSQKPMIEKEFNHGEFEELNIYDFSGDVLIKKYNIYDKKPDGYKCLETILDDDIKITQVYSVIDENLYHSSFILDILLAINKDSENQDFSGMVAYKDGAFKLFDQKDRLLIVGDYYKKNKIKLWTNYYYEQQVKIESNYKANILQDEKYLTLDDELFSGKFVFENSDENIREVRKIKDGLRNGKTLFFDLTTGKKLRKESYSKGIKK